MSSYDSCTQLLTNHSADPLNYLSQIIINQFPSNFWMDGQKKQYKKYNLSLLWCFTDQCYQKYQSSKSSDSDTNTVVLKQQVVLKLKGANVSVCSSPQPFFQTTSLVLFILFKKKKSFFPMVLNNVLDIDIFKVLCQSQKFHHHYNTVTDLKSRK